ncbi:glycosylphosphatidylinositol anchor biosynthesis [Elasticomyces elasticus]|nr:glycosylphosphatidylinositol anchor biosynthesis [Elasticomyces elasticus]
MVIQEENEAASTSSGSGIEMAAEVRTPLTVTPASSRRPSGAEQSRTHSRNPSDGSLLCAIPAIPNSDLNAIPAAATSSTSSDSIWALSFLLMILNVFTFDYGASAHAKFLASLSTNAALMASTVLASRLPSTTMFSALRSSPSKSSASSRYSVDIFVIIPGLGIFGLPSALLLCLV